MHRHRLISPRTTPRLTPRRLALRLRLAAVICCLGAGAAPSEAHDTWFERQANAAAPGPQLALGTGNRYPVMESGVDAKYLARQGCWVAGSAGDPPQAPMTRVRDDPKALLLQAPPRAHTCWAQLQPFTLQMTPDKVALYLREIQAPAAVQQTWAAQKAAGLAWTEQYTKHARIALPPPAQGPGDGPGSWAQPVDMAMDLLVQLPQPDTLLRSGNTLQVQLLRGGQPLAGQALELQSAATGVAAGTGRNLGGAVGLWRRTDAQGRASWPALAAGAWLVRGTELRLAAPGAGHGQRWESDFITLAFEVLP
jgi:hypothetical protein